MIIVVVRYQSITIYSVTRIRIRSTQIRRQFNVIFRHCYSIKLSTFFVTKRSIRTTRVQVSKFFCLFRAFNTLSKRNLFQPADSTNTKSRTCVFGTIRNWTFAFGRNSTTWSSSTAKVKRCSLRENATYIIYSRDRLVDWSTFVNFSSTKHEYNHDVFVLGKN